MFRPPPPHALGFRSDHLDEIHAFIAAYDGNHRRTAPSGGPLGHSVHAARCGQVDLGWSLTRARQQIRGVPQAAILHVPLGRRHVYAADGRTLEARPDTAVLLAPGHEYTLCFEPDDSMVGIRLPGAALADELGARNRPGAPVRLATRELPLAGDRLRTLVALHGALVDATTPAPAGARARPAEHLEADLTSWLANQVLGTRPASPRPALAIQRVRSVEAWIDAHLADPITLGRLCAVAGVGDRCLESAFRAHRGQTPLQFVTARRLAWVRRRLLEACAKDSVTQFAHDAGFVHLGRFAISYRRAYGESPSTTLRRSAKRD